MSLTSLSTEPLVLAKARTLLFRRASLLWFVLIAALLVISRVAFAPRHLNTFDDINFALSISHFNPAQQQPQPPGYPLFVGLLRLGALFVPSIEHLFLLIALLASVLSLAFLWAVGDHLLGKPIGLIAALLLLFHPNFWFAALTNPIRVFLAAGATGVSLCLVKALDGSRRIGWYYLAALALGVAAGFRPFLLVTLMPLMLYAAWQLRLTLKEACLALALTVVSTAAWLTAIVLPVGGPIQFVELMRDYWDQQGASTSILLGAPVTAALHMAYMTTVWTFTGVLSWLWCVPFVSRRQGRFFRGSQILFLLFWFVPGFLFYAIVHTGDPDHPLSVVPVTCLVGAVFLNRFARQRAPRWLPAIVALAVGLNALLFFKPVNKTAKAGSYKVARWLDGYMQGVIEPIRAARAKGPVTVVSLEVTPGWRNISYYFPDVHTLVISSKNRNQPFGWQSYERQGLPLPVKAGSVLLPSCGTIAWIDSTARPISSTGAQAKSRTPNAPLSYVQASPGASYQFQGFTFQTEHQPCSHGVRESARVGRGGGTQ